MAKLPAPKYRLPRARKIPEPKALTKWQKFAQEKGIKKQKRDKKVYDQELDVSERILEGIKWNKYNFLCFLEMGAHVRIQEGRCYSVQGVGAGGATEC